MNEQKNRLLEWAQALESGRYAPSDDAFRRGHGYGPLGVGLDLLPDTAWAVDEVESAYEEEPVYKIQINGRDVDYPLMLLAERYGIDDRVTDALLNLTEVYEMPLPAVGRGLRHYAEHRTFDGWFKTVIFNDFDWRWTFAEVRQDA